MQFIDILKLINLCIIAFFYMEYNKKVARLVASLEEEKKNVARLVASLEEEKKNVARLVASLEAVASLEEEKKTVASLEVASLEVASLEAVASLEEEEKKTVASLEVASLEDEDMETLYIYDFEGTGEQLRRLRAYNKKNDEETEDEYTNRIWNIADKEDEEEKLKKAANEIVVDEPLENDVNTWYITNNGKYKGEWKNGLPNGKGIYEFTASKSIIECNFVNGIAYGFGRQIFEKAWDEKTVPYYEGEFKKNHYDGKGEYHYGDGRYYKGEFKDSKYHGQGAEYSHIMRKTWVGEYYNDKKMKGEWM